MHSVMRPNAVDAVAWSVCLLVMTVNPAKTDEPIEMPFTPPLQGTMSYVIIYLLCSEPENSQHYNTPDKQVECTLEPLHFSPFVYTPGLDLYCYYVLYSYYAILAERQNNTVQRAHVHANTSTKKTQGDNRLCMKLFKTGSIDVVKYCQRCFATDLPSCDLKRSRVSLYYDTFPQ